MYRNKQSNQIIIAFKYDGKLETIKNNIPLIYSLSQSKNRSNLSDATDGHRFVFKQDSNNELIITKELDYSSNSSIYQLHIKPNDYIRVLNNTHVNRTIQDFDFNLKKISSKELKNNYNLVPNHANNASNHYYVITETMGIGMDGDITTIPIKVDKTKLDAIHDMEKYNQKFSPDFNGIHDEPDEFNFVKVGMTKPNFMYNKFYNSYSDD